MCESDDDITKTKVVSEFSVQALMEVIERHKLEVDDAGNYQITEEMGKEAEALDAAAGRSTNQRRRR